jgi:hypothetical protein
MKVDRKVPVPQAYLSDSRTLEQQVGMAVNGIGFGGCDWHFLRDAKGAIIEGQSRTDVRKLLMRMRQAAPKRAISKKVPASGNARVSANSVRSSKA